MALPSKGLTPAQALMTRAIRVLVATPAVRVNHGNDRPTLVWVREREAMSRVTAIKTFFERQDDIAPSGGRKVTMDELRLLSNDDREELAELAARELGTTIDAK